MRYNIFAYCEFIYINVIINVENLKIKKKNDMIFAYIEVEG